MAQQFNIQNENAKAAMQVVRTLHRSGFHGFFVGGCVRDLLLGYEPQDYDVATNAIPQKVKALFPKTIAVGEKFGVVLVVMGDATIEVATFRKETGYSDRRRPDHVEFSSAEEDAARRDFTINALFMDPISGRIHDFVNGQKDIGSRIIRCVGNPEHRFSEDALRPLRALRFASSLDFQVEETTWKAITRFAPLVHEISRERVRDELVKGFTRPHPDRFLELLHTSGLLIEILPEVEDMVGCEQPPAFHPEGDVFVHTKLMLSLLPPSPSVPLVFATLLHDVGKPPTTTNTDRIRFNNHNKVGARMADAICRRFAFPNAEREQIVEMVLRHMDFINIFKMKKSTLRRFLASPYIDDEVELHRVDCLGSHGDLENYNFAREQLAAFRSEASEGTLPPPLITGQDLIDLGLKPGPTFRTILTELQDAQLEGCLTTREEALVELKKICVERGLLPARNGDV